MERRPLDVATAVAESALEHLQPWVKRAEIAGSIRRRRPEVKDIEIVAEPIDVADGLFGETRPASAEIREFVATWGHLTKGGDKYVQVADVLGSGLTLDLFLVTPPASFAAIFAIRTGPASYSEMLVTRLRGRLWRCAEGRVLDDLGREVSTPTEQDFFRACGVEWAPPEARG